MSDGYFQPTKVDPLNTNNSTTYIDNHSYFKVLVLLFISLIYIEYIVNRVLS